MAYTLGHHCLRLYLEKERGTTVGLRIAHMKQKSANNIKNEEHRQPCSLGDADVASLWNDVRGRNDGQSHPRPNTDLNRQIGLQSSKYNELNGGTRGESGHGPPSSLVNMICNLF